MPTTDTRPASSLSNCLNVALARTVAEFREMPGLQLTPAQAARLVGTDVHTATSLLAALARDGFLRATPRGFVRA
jgi:hypothetical protein